MSLNFAVVFCSDQRGLPGLHVAAFSLLSNVGHDAGPTRICVFSDSLTANDSELLEQTLSGAGRAFKIEVVKVDGTVFKGFPPLQGSWAAYFRLYAAQVLDADRILYVDVDTLCDLDIGPLKTMDMKGFPAAWVPEAPLSNAVDRVVAAQLGNSDQQYYFNSGVVLIDVPVWRRQNISERAMAYIATESPRYHDQSALNVILYRNSLCLDPRFNCRSNVRENWKLLQGEVGATRQLIHFIDSPKPWDLFGEFVHPQYHLWRAILDKTAIRDFRSWKSGARRFPGGFQGYKRLLKDRLLFAAFRRKWIKRVKGMSE